MSIQEDLRRYLIEEMGWSGAPESLTDEANLLEHQVLDSLAVVELSTLLEQWYSIRVEATDLVYDNFHSLGAIAEFVEKRRVATA